MTDHRFPSWKWGNLEERQKPLEMSNPCYAEGIGKMLGCRGEGLLLWSLMGSELDYLDEIEVKAS